MFVHAPFFLPAFLLLHCTGRQFETEQFFHDYQCSLKRACNRRLTAMSSKTSCRNMLVTFTFLFCFCLRWLLVCSCRQFCILLLVIEMHMFLFLKWIQFLCSSVKTLFTLLHESFVGVFHHFCFQSSLDMWHSNENFCYLLLSAATCEQLAWLSCLGGLYLLAWRAVNTSGEVVF